jgi:hypothetical protein
VLAVVAHQFIGKGGEPRQAAAPPIASPTDQQFYGTRAAAFTPRVPSASALRATENLFVAAGHLKDAAALPTAAAHRQAGHCRPRIDTAAARMSSTSRARNSGSRPSQPSFHIQ